MNVATMTYAEFKALPVVNEPIETVDPITHHTVIRRGFAVVLMVEAWWRDREENQVYEIGWYTNELDNKEWAKSKTNVFDPIPCYCVDDPEPGSGGGGRAHAP